MIDAPAMGSVNITAYTRSYEGLAPGTPKAGVIVVAVQPTGLVGGTATTDAAGKATLSGVIEGATVTAVYPEDTDNRSTRIVSYVGVKPDDQLTVGDKYFENGPATTGTDGQLNVTIAPPPAALGTVAYYRLYNPCEGYNYLNAGTTSTSLALYQGCQTATAPLLLAAFDGNGTILASNYLATAAYTVGANVTFATAGWAAPSSFSVSMTGITVANPYVYFDVVMPLARLYTIYGSDNGEPKSGALTRTVSIPNVPGTSPYLSASLSRGGNYSSQYAFKGGPSPIGLTAPTLPWLSGVIYGANTAVWIQTAGTYDAATLTLEWQKERNKQTHYYDWTLILPPGVKQFEIPTPPAELADYVPATDDNVDYDLRLIDLASADSYDALRELPEWRAMDPESAVRTGDEPSAATTGYDGGEGSGF